MEEMGFLQTSISKKLDLLATETVCESLPPSSHPIYTGMVVEVNKQLNEGFKDLSKSLNDCAGDQMETIAGQHSRFTSDQEVSILEVQL
jgi:hypothetical protein